MDLNPSSDSGTLLQIKRVAVDPRPFPSTACPGSSKRPGKILLSTVSRAWMDSCASWPAKTWLRRHIEQKHQRPMLMDRR